MRWWRRGVHWPLWPHPIRHRLSPLARFGARAGLIALLLYLLSPYWVLWRLDQAVRQESAVALAPLVALDTVRDQLRRRLNKDCDSLVGEVSDAFIHWLEQGLRADGPRALDTRVSLSWVEALLRERCPPERGLRAAVRHAFFDPPRGFLVRIAAPGTVPLYLLLQPAPLAWRITAVYY